MEEIMHINLREAGYRLDIPEGSIAPFEEKILASGLCDFALDMTFTRFRGSTRASYDCDGYVAVKELDLMRPQKVFEVLEKTLLTLNHAGEFFIDRDKVLLNTDTVFYNRRCKDVRIAYFPRSEGMEIRQSVEEYVRELAAMTGEKGRSLLERTLLLFSQNNCGLPQMITVVGEIRRAVAVQAAAG
jgi:hypothetical protein